jgi:archaemetzincin
MTTWLTEPRRTGAILVRVTPPALARFTPPGADARRAAIGPLEGLPAPLRRAFEPDSDFAPVPPPGPDDWLANHAEPGQTYEQFVHTRPHRPDRERNVLYLRPVSEFGPGAPALDRLQEFAAAFFQLPVHLLPALAPAARELTTRINPQSGRRQILTGDILGLIYQGLPRNAYALLGITMEDLYPDSRWNFVFGQASLRHRVGVYSFARYDPRFYGEERPAEWEQLLVRRSCKVLAHEMTHMFGVEHCIFFRCLMNGSNHLAESDARPLHLCPVDLRKLQESVGFDVLQRYLRLWEVCRASGFADEVAWFDRRLEHLTRP